MFLLTPFQTISRIPSVYKSLQETVLDCNRHFDTVIRDARVAFTEISARRALDDWIFLVSEAAAEIKEAYSKSKAGAIHVVFLGSYD